MPVINWDNVREQAVASRRGSENIFSTYGGILQISNRGEGTEDIIIRLLAHDSDDIPIVLTHKHNLKASGKTKSYFCYKSVGKHCPICEQSNRMYRENKNGNWYTLRSVDTVNVNCVVVQAENQKLVGKVYTLQLDEFRNKELVKIIYNIKTNPFDLENGCNLNIHAEVTNNGRHNVIDFSKTKWEAPSPINIDGMAISQEEANEIISKLRSLCEYKNSLEVPELSSYVAMIKEETGLEINLEADKVENIPKPSSMKPQEKKIEVPKEELRPVAAAAKPAPASAKPADDDDDDLEFMNRLSDKYKNK